MSVARPLVRIPVGVIAERRKAMSPWLETVWRPAAVLMGVPGTAPWTMLAAAENTATFYVGAAEIELYRTETDHYRSNLDSGAPSVWIALRPTGSQPPFDLFAVTADPAEGESFTQAGDDLVDAVPMPPAVREILEAFVAEHHIEQPNYRRKRDCAGPETLVSRAPTRKVRHE